MNASHHSPGHSTQWQRSDTNPPWCRTLNDTVLGPIDDGILPTRTQCLEPTTSFKLHRSSTVTAVGRFQKDSAPSVARSVVRKRSQSRLGEGYASQLRPGQKEKAPQVQPPPPPPPFAPAQPTASDAITYSKGVTEPASGREASGLTPNSAIFSYHHSANPSGQDRLSDDMWESANKQVLYHRTQGTGWGGKTWDVGDSFVGRNAIQQRGGTKKPTLGLREAQAPKHGARRNMLLAPSATAVGLERGLSRVWGG
ncbi:hypothetical protein J3F83DRAFT_207411 [Trichoderma novae-zelandiae]